MQTYTRQFNIYTTLIRAVSRHVGRDCRHPEHMDVLVNYAL